MFPLSYCRRRVLIEISHTIFTKLPTVVPMNSRKRHGSLDGRWTSILLLTEVCSDGSSFVCNICLKSGKSQRRSTVQSSGSAPNLHTHFRHAHPEVYSIIEPIIRSRDKNKRLCPTSYTIAETFARSTQRRLEDEMLCLLSSPEVPHRLFCNTRFQRVLSVLNPNCVIQSLKTLDSSLWQ